MADDFTAFDRRRPRNRSLRAGDAERDAVAVLLREHHVAGRLGADEFHGRLDRCMAARTHADLDRLVDDLPAAAGPAPRPRWRPWPLVLVPLLVAAIALSGGRAAWLAVPLLFVFVVRPMMWRPSRRCGARAAPRSGA